MKTTRKFEVKKCFISKIAVALFVAMIFSVLSGIAPGSSIKAQAAGKYLSDYSVGDVLTNDSRYYWNDGREYCKVIVQGGGHVDSHGDVILSDTKSSFADDISFDVWVGAAIRWGDNCYPYDGNSRTETWYVVDINKESKTITLSGIAPTL